jgi:hypothetical protein
MLAAPMPENKLDYYEIRYRLETQAAFRILRKDGAAFMLGFLHEQFKLRHRADIGQAELGEALAAYAELLRLSGEDEALGRGASRADVSAYLDAWANEGFLRKYYPQDAAEACYDLTPATERALEWVAELSGRGFVGAESQLKALADGLRELAYGAAFDPEERRAELLRQREALDDELARLDRGEAERLDDTRVAERYYAIEDAARRLLADFKQIEENFRELDRETKERIIASEGARGRVLKELFEHRDAIMASDQGKSFQAFWAYLMSLDTRDELAALVERVLGLDAVKAAKRSFPLDSLDARLVAAGARVQRMTHRLHEELKNFLDERARREAKLAAAYIDRIKRLALAARDDPPSSRTFLVIEGEPELNLVMDRPLYRPEEPVVIGEAPAALGSGSARTDELYDQELVELSELADRLRAALTELGQVGVSELAARWRPTRGAAELVGYLRLASIAPSIAQAERRSLVEADNLARGSSILADCPDPIFLAEVQP